MKKHGNRAVRFIYEGEDRSFTGVTGENPFRLDFKVSVAEGLQEAGLVNELVLS